MSKKYRVLDGRMIEMFGLKVGDIVTKVEGSAKDDLYELPKHLHRRGHTGDLLDAHLNLQEPNYLYIDTDELEEVKENE